MDDVIEVSSDGIWLWLTPLIGFVVAMAAALVAATVVSALLRLVGRKRSWPTLLQTRVLRPFRTTLVVLALWIAGLVTLDPRLDPLPGIVDYILMITTIAACGWLLASVVLFFVDLALSRHPIDMPDNRSQRRVRTQILIVRRVVIAVVVVLTLGAILLTIPGVEAIGTSLLASAGLLSVIAGVAAQSALANMFAGMQLAFSDAIRIDDVVVVEGEWGKIEEITLTSVVVHIWDDRRLVLPSTYFTTTPFQNWTRSDSRLLNTVLFDVDWSVDVDAVRGELDRVLGSTQLWDGRVGLIQVTDATGGKLQFRALVSAKDGPTMYDLQVLVRERLVAFIQHEHPGQLVVQRVRVMNGSADRELRSRPESAASEAGGVDG